MDLLTIQLAFKKAKKYIDSFVIPQGAISVPIPRDQLAQDVRNSLSNADNEPDLRHKEITEALGKEADNRQSQIEKVTSEQQKTNAVVEAIHTSTYAGIFSGGIGDDILINVDKFSTTAQTIAPGKTMIFDSEGSIAVYTGGGLLDLSTVIGNVIPVRIKSKASADGDSSPTMFMRRIDGFFLRLSRMGIINIPPGTIGDLLANFVLPDNIALSAHINKSEWSMNGSALVFPKYAGYTDYNISVRIYGDAGGTAQEIREFQVLMVRQRDGSTAAKSGLVKVTNTDLEANAFNFLTYTNDVTDSFIDGGVRLVLNNTSGEQITLSQVDVVIKGAAYGA